MSTYRSGGEQSDKKKKVSAKQVCGVKIDLLYISTKQ